MPAGHYPRETPERQLRLLRLLRGINAAGRPMPPMRVIAKLCGYAGESSARMTIRRLVRREEMRL